MSSHQLHRMLGVTYKTAWFMSHRIREAMRDDGTSPLGGNGKTVEADETYIGADRHRALPATYRNGEGWVAPRSAAAKGKRKVVALVERDGRSRAFHVDHINAKTVRGVLVRNEIGRAKV